MKLFMILLGCRPAGRVTEQHDIFFGIAEELADLKPAMERFWPEGKSNLHIDVWREVTSVGGYAVEVNASDPGDRKLYFVNLGGYRQSVFDELHQKLLLVADSLSDAVAEARRTDFFRDNSFSGAQSHIDEKFGFDVDEVETVHNLLSRCGFPGVTISLSPSETAASDKIQRGYLPLSKL